MSEVSSSKNQVSDNLSRLIDLSVKLSKKVPLPGMINGDAYTCSYAAEELRAKREEVERLRAALERYGKHEDSCLAVYGADGDQCSCGYAEFCPMCKGRQPVETTVGQEK